jgi:hypothetical protein
MGIFFYKMPESFKAFCNMVSLMAANTSRMLDVSVACVKLRFSNISKRSIVSSKRRPKLTGDKCSAWLDSLD